MKTAIPIKNTFNLIIHKSENIFCSVKVTEKKKDITSQFVTGRAKYNVVVGSDCVPDYFVEIIEE